MATTIPAKTHAARVFKTGGPEVIELAEVDAPNPQPEQILVKIDWAGVNYADTSIRASPSTTVPYTLGLESSGTIIKLPTSDEVLQNEAYKRQGFKIGDKVAALAGPGYTEYAAVPWTRVLVLPSGVDPRYGASFWQGLTALTTMKESYQVKKGDWILVHAVAGGLGLQYAQIGKRLGANIIGTTSTAEKAEIAKQYGADHVVLYQDNLVDAVKKFTDGKGVAAIFDTVGKDTWEANLDLIARKGTIVSIGAASGPVPPFDLGRLRAKNVQVSTPTVFGYVSTLEEFHHYTQEYVRLLQDGVKVPIHKEYPFSAEGIRQSHIDIVGRGTAGKLLINVSGHN